MPPYRRERWATPDGDFIDLDWLPQHTDAPLLVLFHGLEGSSRSHYARSIMGAALALGWNGVVPHFRGCSGEPNRFARAYHSGDSAEIDWILARLAARHPAPVVAAGVSLGGNALLKWLGERAARTLYDFDDAYTGPAHGFEGADDYWRRASARPWLGSIRLPCLLLVADNDPFVPAAAWPDPSRLPPSLRFEVTAGGGHVGFPGGVGVAAPGWLAQRTLAHFAGILQCDIR